MSELPFDILVEILVRLPVKDIVRFRCVCQKWRLLFQEERFISQHTTFAPSMFLVNYLHLDRSYVYEYDDRSFNRNMIVKNQDLKDYARNTHFNVAGHYGTVVVWNPSLRESRTIPTLSQTFYHHHCHAGFGYDHSIKDYKILLIPMKKKLRGQAEILTLKSSPRKFDIPYEKDFYDKYTSTNGTLVGDYLFWQLAYNESEKTNETILSFNIVSEKISYSSSPCSDNDGFLVLTLFGRRLCMVNHLAVRRFGRIYFFNEITVWCADHEEKDMSRIRSWSKLFRLEQSDNIERPIDCTAIYGVMIETVTKGGDFFLKVCCGDSVNFKVFAYNFEKKEVRETNLHLGNYFVNGVFEYKATLVPIHNTSNLKILESTNEQSRPDHESKLTKHGVATV